LRQSLHELIDAPASIFVRLFCIENELRTRFCHFGFQIDRPPLAAWPLPPHARVGHNFDRLIHVIENDQLVVESEHQVRQLAIVLRRVRELFGFVISNRVVARIADETAGERRQISVAKILSFRQQMRQIRQRIARSKLSRRFAGFPDDRIRAGRFVDETRRSSDEAISRDPFTAHDTLQQKRPIVPAEHLERCHRRQMVRQQLAIHRNDRVILRKLGERGGIRKVMRHVLTDCKRQRIIPAMPFEITVSREFCAAHQLRLYDGSLEPLHGHNWHQRVTVATDNLDVIGTVMDFHELARLVDEIIRPMNNRNLNELPAFQSTNPSAENVALHVAHSLKLPNDVRLVCVEITEAPNCVARYVP